MSFPKSSAQKNMARQSVKKIKRKKIKSIFKSVLKIFGEGIEKI
jgi:hypothetical protein